MWFFRCAQQDGVEVGVEVERGRGVVLATERSRGMRVSYLRIGRGTPVGGVVVEMTNMLVRSGRRYNDFLVLTKRR